MSTRQGVLRLYLNTSMLIRALEDPEAKEFLARCCSRHRCVVSSVHWRGRRGGSLASSVFRLCYGSWVLRLWRLT